MACTCASIGRRGIARNRVIGCVTVPRDRATARFDHAIRTANSRRILPLEIRDNRAGSLSDPGGTGDIERKSDDGLVLDLGP